MPDQLVARRATVRRRVRAHHVVHHLVCVAAMALCVVADSVPALALLTAVGLAGVSVAWAKQARTDRSARELLLDLWVMVVCMVVMLPTMAASSVTSIGGAGVPAAHSHGAGALAGGGWFVLALALLGWGALRIRSLFAAGRPSVLPVLGALLCGAGLVWMLS